jgi:hypothetical protein
MSRPCPLQGICELSPSRCGHRGTRKPGAASARPLSSTVRNRSTAARPRLAYPAALLGGVGPVRRCGGRLDRPMTRLRIADSNEGGFRGRSYDPRPPVSSHRRLRRDAIQRRRSTNTAEVALWRSFGFEIRSSARSLGTRAVARYTFAIPPATRSSSVRARRGRRFTRRDEVAGGQKQKRTCRSRLLTPVFLKRERLRAALGVEWPKRWAASLLIGVRSSRLHPLLQCCRAGGRGEDARVAVVPADSKAWRLLLEDLLDDASAHRLGDPLRLDDDYVSRLCGHSFVHLPARLQARLYSAIMQREEVRGGDRRLDPPAR